MLRWLCPRGPYIVPPALRRLPHLVIGNKFDRCIKKFLLVGQVGKKAAWHKVQTIFDLFFSHFCIYSAHLQNVYFPIIIPACLILSLKQSIRNLFFIFKKYSLRWNTIIVCGPLCAFIWFSRATMWSKRLCQTLKRLALVGLALRPPATSGNWIWPSEHCCKTFFFNSNKQLSEFSEKMSLHFNVYLQSKSFFQIK